MGPIETVKIRLKRFLDYLTALGKEKGKINNGFFKYTRVNQKIVMFLKKKYGNKQCTEPETIVFDATDYSSELKLITLDSDIQSIIRCIIQKTNDRTFYPRQLIFLFKSDNKISTSTYGHMSLLVINMDTKEIVRIDPEGEGSNENFYFKEMGEHLTQSINKRLYLVEEDKKYKYIHDFDKDCPLNLNPQKKIGQLSQIKSLIIHSEHRPSKIETGTCVLWSLLFSELIIVFPEMEYKEVLRYLALYIQDNFETILYLIRGYFWYLQKEVLKMLNDEEKEEILNDDDYYDYISKDEQPEKFDEYISKLETNPYLYYSPLEFIDMFEKISKILDFLRNLDTTVKKAAEYMLSIYESLYKRFEKMNTYLESKEDFYLDDQLIFLIKADNFMEVKTRYGDETRTIWSLRYLKKKINLEMKNEEKGERYKDFYKKALEKIKYLEK